MLNDQTTEGHSLSTGCYYGYCVNETWKGHRDTLWPYMQSPLSYSILPSHHIQVLITIIISKYQITLYIHAIDVLMCFAIDTAATIK